MKQAELELISIVVPVYNAEKYLSVCIRSLQEQTWTNLEIILVNDGSQDGSGAICDSLAATDSRIRVIHKENEGVSAARNDGIVASRGCYLGFVDADDLCEPEMYERLFLGLSLHKADISLCRYNDYDGNSKLLHPEPLRAGLYGRQEILHTLIADMVGVASKLPQCAQVMGSMCRCLFKRRVAEHAPPIRLERVKMAEDLLYVIEYLGRSQTVYVDGGAFYNYRHNPNSATRGYMEGAYETITTQVSLMRELLQRMGLFTDEISERLSMSELYNISTCICNECHLTNKASICIILKKIKQYRQHPCFRQLSWELISRIKTKEKYFYALIKLQLYLFILLFVRGQTQINQ